MSTWANRAASALAALLVVTLAHVALPDASTRARLLYTGVLTLGYGHLAGAALGGLARSRPGSCEGIWLGRALGAASLAVGFCGYTALLKTWPVLLLPALAVSVWHTIENDLALADTCEASGRARPLPRGWRHHATGLAGTLFVTGGAALTREGRALTEALAPKLARLAASPPPFELADFELADLELADVFALTTLHHLFSWLALAQLRIRAERRSGDSRRARRSVLRLAAVHAIPTAACVVVLAGPGLDSGAGRLLFSPALYLFWALLHVAHTCHARGFAARGSAPSNRISPRTCLEIQA